MPATEDELMARLEELGIETRTHRHAPMYTVEESRALRGDLPGGHCKTLFLRNKKGNLWLVITLEDRDIDLKALAKAIGANRLSFAGAELMWEILGVKPGAVTPFALINDGERRCTVVLDRHMLDHDPLNYHPLRNEATTAIAPGDLLRFVESCGFEPLIIDFLALT